MRSNYLKLRNKADKVFSKYIRSKATAETGYTKCISCGKLLTYAEAEAGHYMSRRYMNTRYDERNVHCQCAYCNKWLSGNIQLYRRKLVSLYGEKEVEAIENLALMESGITGEWLAYMIEECKNKIKNIDNNENNIGGY